MTDLNKNNELVPVNENDELDLGSVNDSGLDNRRKNDTLNKRIILGVACLVILILIGSQAFSFFKSNDEEKAPETSNQITVESKSNFKTQTTNNKDDEVKLFDFGNDKPTEIEDQPRELLGADTNTAYVTADYGTKPPLRRSSGNLMIKHTSENYNEPNSNHNGSGSDPNDLLGGSGSNDLFNAPAFQAQSARKGQFNQHLLLSQGTVIPCSLRGRLVSNVGGQISCIVADNVLSASGAVVLIDKGSIINGFYEGNSVQRGHNEIFVVWQEARTPNNLVIPLFSGSTDPLGANGLSGWVDNHFWERFGNAMMLSLFKDVSGALSQNLTKDSRQNTFENTQNEATNLASEIIKRSIDIEPTLYKNQGDKINIFVARDIDFSNVYNLRRNFRR